MVENVNVSRFFKGTYDISDIKSVYGTNSGVIGINTFSADIIQATTTIVGVATINAG